MKDNFLRLRRAAPLFLLMCGALLVAATTIAAPRRARPADSGAASSRRAQEPTAAEKAQSALREADAALRRRDYGRAAELIRRADQLLATSVAANQTPPSEPNGR